MIAIYMNEFMQKAMNDQNARGMMMNNMFMMADQDSSIAQSMYDHMNNYEGMMNHMRMMMNNNQMMQQDHMMN
ncbi:MAG: hypothetical protein U5K00_04200 [Melioribacteraceae bacterium]|nr:hypothetical protein [Melioribacteraceae bacterium]